MDEIARFEDVIYNEEIEIVDEPNAEVYKESLLAYDKACILKELPELPAFQELVKVLVENAQRCSETERAYRGIDKEKKEKLWLARVIADSTLSTVRGIVEEAATIPMPRYKEQ